MTEVHNFYSQFTLFKHVNVQVACELCKNYTRTDIVINHNNDTRCFRGKNYYNNNSEKKKPRNLDNKPVDRERPRKIISMTINNVLER